MTKSNNNLIRDKNLHLLFSVTLIAIMGVASITPAFPGVRKFFKITPGEVALLVTFFTLPGIILRPAFGIFADRWGRKKVLVPSLFLFGTAGGLCFFIRDFHLLVLLRFFQGVGAASLGSVNVTIIGDLYEGNVRTTAMGYNASVLSIGTASFPIIGGVLATIGWYYPFLLPLLAIPVGILILFVLNNPEPSAGQTLKEYFYDTLKILRNKNILGLLLISVLTFVILYGPYLTYFPFLVGETFDKPPYFIGIIMSVASFASMSVSSQAGNLTKLIGYKVLILYSSFFYIASMIIVPFIHSVWFLILPALLFGVGQGLNLPSVQSMLVSLAPMNQRGIIMSLNGSVFSLGQTLGPLLVVPVYTLWGSQGAFVFGAIMSLFISLSALFFVKNRTY